MVEVERRLLVEVGRLYLGLDGTSDFVLDGLYSSSPESSSVLSSALDMVSAAALAVFRRGRGETGLDEVTAQDAMILWYGMRFWICGMFTDASLK
jgi:hypothetical protein